MGMEEAVDRLLAAGVEKSCGGKDRLRRGKGKDANPVGWTGERVQQSVTLQTLQMQIGSLSSSSIAQWHYELRPCGDNTFQRRRSWEVGIYSKALLGASFCSRLACYLEL